jgi:hypothetical protein
MRKRIIAGSSPARDSTAMVTGPDLLLATDRVAWLPPLDLFAIRFPVMSTVDVRPSAVLLLMKLLVLPDLPICSLPPPFRCLALAASGLLNLPFASLRGFPVILTPRHSSRVAVQ